MSSHSFKLLPKVHCSDLSSCGLQEVLCAGPNSLDVVRGGLEYVGRNETESAFRDTLYSRSRVVRIEYLEYARYKFEVGDGSREETDCIECDS
jgi:hypothetical protein